MKAGVVLKTIALRFSSKFASECETIDDHNEMIRMNGYVWYGKLGNKIATGVFTEILGNEKPKILLIHSGVANRYWAYVNNIRHEISEREGISVYYGNEAEKIRTLFRVTRFEDAPLVIKKNNAGGAR